MRGMHGREVPLLWNSEWFPSLTFSPSPCEPSRLLSAILSQCLGLILLSPSPVSFCIPDKYVTHNMHPHPRPPTTWLLPRLSLMPSGPSLHGSHLCLISAVVSLPLGHISLPRFCRLSGDGFSLLSCTHVWKLSAHLDCVPFPCSSSEGHTAVRVPHTWTCSRGPYPGAKSSDSGEALSRAM